MAPNRCSVALCVLALSVTPNAFAEPAPAEPPSIGPWQSQSIGFVPTDKTLEALDARIGRVQVHVDEVFEQATSLAAPYRVANGLHVATRPTAVRSQLLFEPGEPYSRRALEETARVLRASRYLSDAAVEPVRYNEADNTVDVEVRVHDVWTMSSGFSFGRKGGKNSARLKFEDSNFLGFGKQVGVSRSEDVDRSGWRFTYDDPNVLGSRWRFAGAYGASSDGSEKLFDIGRPFYSLNTRNAFQMLAVDATTAETRYRQGEIVDKFQMAERRFEIGGGVSSGLQNGWVRRLLAGVRYERRTFTAIEGYESSLLPDDRTLVYPWLGLEWVEDEYRRTRNLDQIGRTEDIYLGSSARLEAGFAGTAFGSTNDSLLMKGDFRTAFELSEDQYLMNVLRLEGRLQEGAVRNGKLDLESRYYLRQSPRRVLFAAATATLAERLDREEQLLLGGDNGLRGYPLRYQAGAAKALVTLEERFYTRWQPLKLFNVGAAVFFDAGRTWGRDEAAGDSLGWLKDVGVGLRLGSVRSGLGNVLHIDLAFPLDATPDMDSVQFLIETRRTF